MPQVHDGRPAQTCQTTEHGWTSEEELEYLRRLLAISTNEKGATGRKNERLDLLYQFGKMGSQTGMIDTRSSVQSAGTMR